MSSQIWDTVWPELPGRRHVGIDLPGHGTKQGHPWPRDLTELAHHVADELVAQDCRTLIGLSFGSSVALQVALDRPGTVDRLILAAPTLGGPVDDPSARAKYLLMSRIHAMVGPGRALTEVWMADPPPIFAGLRGHPLLAERMRAVIEGHSFAELGTGAMRAIAESLQTPADLARVSVPTLVIIGEDDMPRFRANAEAIAASIPDCVVHTIPGAGHLPLIERSTFCAGLLAGFAPEAQPYACADSGIAGPASTPRSSSRE